jgi:fructose-1-phosphate kinase PfkB-like protein
MVNHSRNLIKEYSLEMVMVTLGSEGILLINEIDGFHAKSPPLEPINSAGAGDAASAAFVYQLFLGQSLENALMMACATSAAVVLSEGTAEFSMETMKSLLPKIQLLRINQSY